MMEAIRPSSSSKSTRFRATRPPNRLVTPRVSRKVAISGLAQLARAAARGEDALRPEDHHEHEDHRACVAQLVEPEGKALEDLEVEHGDHGGAEDSPGDGTHASEDDHGEHADGLHEGEGLRVDEDLLGGEEDAYRPREGSAAGEGEELHSHEGHAHGLGCRLVLADGLPGPADMRVLETT